MDRIAAPASSNTSSSPSTLSEPPTELNAVPVIPEPLDSISYTFGKYGARRGSWYESPWPTPECQYRPVRKGSSCCLPLNRHLQPYAADCGARR